MGSRRWFRYTTDDGTAYAIQADESNTELVNDAAETSASVGGLDPLPKGYSPRYIRLENAAGTIRRDCYVLTQAEYAAANNSTDYLLTAANFSGVSADTTVNVVLKQPELIRRQPRIGDTGLIDGDNP